MSHEDALAAVDGDEPVGADDTSWVNVLHYRHAMDFVLALARQEDFEYTPGILKSLHFMMLRHSPEMDPGSWRPGAIYVRKEATGEIVYEGPPYDEVPGLVKALCVVLSAEDGEKPSRLIRAAMAHLNLVMIHPFRDGNGRMARCLQSLVVARGAAADDSMGTVMDPTFSSIEEYLGRNTQDYYNVLAEVGQGSWNPQNDALPWVRFCLTAHYRQALSAKRRLEATASIGEQVEHLLERKGLPDRAATAVTNAALGYKLRNDAYRRSADVSQVVASRDLRALSEANFLEARGEKRGRYYVAPTWLIELASRYRDRTPIRDPFSVAV